MIESEDIPEIINSIQGEIRELSPREVVELKLNQLRFLANWAGEQDMVWRQEEGAKIPVHNEEFAHTYETVTIEYTAGPKLRTAVRGSAIVAHVKDLYRLRHLGQVREILFSKQFPDPESTINR